MRLLEKVDLPNGLTLELRDESRRLAGDRWYVGLRACIEIPIPQEFQEEEELEGALNIMRKALGGKAFYHHMMERHFISEAEVQGVLEEMKNTFLEHSLSYLSHPDFPKRFLRAKAAEIRKRAPWGPDYVEKVLREMRSPERTTGCSEGTQAN